MNKLLFIILLLAVTVSANGQPNHPLPMVNGKIDYSEVVNVDGAKQNELHSRAKLWFADTFRSSTNVIQLDDTENGIILGKGSVARKDKSSVLTWHFTLKIQMKDGKYKVEIYNIDYNYYSPSVRIGSSRLPSRDVTVNLDTYFLDEDIYKRNGTLKSRAQFIADETNVVFMGLLASLKESLREKVTKDDF